MDRLKLKVVSWVGMRHTLLGAVSGAAISALSVREEIEIAREAGSQKASQDVQEALQAGI